MIVPTLIREANQVMTARAPNGDYLLKELIPHRSAKLSALPDKMINRKVTIAHSAEMAGDDGVHLLDIENLQEPNGSVGHSPSATAFFARYIQPGDSRSLAYLESVAEDGAVPNVVPFDVFEQAWTLWNLSLIGSLDDDILTQCEPYLDFLENAWQPGSGVGFAAEYYPNDGDDTGLTYEVLKRYGRPMDVEALLHYEDTCHFTCFELESTPSISTNIHMLGALREAEFDRDSAAVLKILHFLDEVSIAGAYWYDKWHVSPYYPTSHAIIACADFCEARVENAVDWIVHTQNRDGSWGYYIPTAEETAYCLQALTVWKRAGHRVSDEAVRRGRAWLLDHTEPPYPPLWIGKCLYCPELVVYSAVLSALYLS
jgi:halimadienyl-diphosphate synthase